MAFVNTAGGCAAPRCVGQHAACAVWCGRRLRALLCLDKGVIGTTRGGKLRSSLQERAGLAACIDVVDTGAYVPLMSKRRSSTSDISGAASTVVAKRSPSVGAKGSINLRIETHTRQLIDDAAAILGKTRTEFMIDSARRQAIDVLLDQRLFVLYPERFDAFIDALDNPPAPGPKLQSLLRRVPAWER